jgi:Cys-tRNA(Pro)/Cys-tRNA(Cys) deacylase
MATHRTPALDLLRREGVEHRVHEYLSAERSGRARAERPDYGSEAATALGVDPGRMFKTLVVVADGRPVAAVVPVDRQLDLKRLAAVLGVRSAVLAEPAAAERASGSVVGGISPLAMRRPLTLVIDASVEVYPTVYVSAGRRGLQVELRPRDLVRIGTAKVATIARSPLVGPSA